MDRKVNEMADSVKNETVNDLLNLFNYNKQQPDMDLVEESITQPPLITTPSNPLILHRAGETYYSFDGRTLFFDKSYKNFYIFLPFSIREACFINLKKKKAKCVILTLDTQNKLSYSDFTKINNSYSISENKIMISRNVLQLVEKNKEIYYLSFKKDHYFLNVINEDNGILKAKILVQNLTSKYSVSIYWTSKNLFLYQDKNIISVNTSKKLKIKGDGVYEIGNFFLIHNKTKAGSLLSLCDDNFIIKDELTLEHSSHVVKILPVHKILCCRAGDKIYFIDAIKKESNAEKSELKIVKEIQVPGNLIDFSVRGENKKVFITYLLQRKEASKKDNNANEKLVEIKILETEREEEFTLPTPEVTSKIYDPNCSESQDLNNMFYDPNCSKPYDSNIWTEDLKNREPTFQKRELSRNPTIVSPNPTIATSNPTIVSSNPTIATSNYNSSTVPAGDYSFFTSRSQKDYSCMNNMGNNLNSNSGNIEEILNCLFSKFEKKIEERDALMKQRQFDLLDKLSESFNSSLCGVIEKVVRSELGAVQQNLINVMTSKISNISRKDVDEERLLEFTKEVICDTLLPVVEASMDEMRIQVVSEVASFRDSDYLHEVKAALANLTVGSEIERNIRSNNIDKAVEYVIKGTSRDMEDFIRLITPDQLETVASINLVGLLEKCILLAKDNHNKEYDEIVYNCLTNIELDSLEDDELRTLIIVLSQIKDSELFTTETNNHIIVLVDFLKVKIPKMLFKRQKSLKN